MASDINPTLEPTKSLNSFRFWCQKVLPLVYDDSLSYYEVLGKMVVQLNDVIDDVNADIENVDTLKEAFLALQTYVNEFFDDIDQLASYAERAEAAQTAANTSAINAASSASNASASSLAAMNARDAAVAAEQAAGTSANNASTAATNASTKANEAAQSATTAQSAQESASQSATSASGSAINAATSASSAQQSFTLADAARAAAQQAANDAESAAELIDMDATPSDVGKAIIVKTVEGGKVSAYEFGEAGSGGGTGGIVNTIENVPVASFDDGTGTPVVELVANIELVQSGSGDPSPTNVRPITGRTGTNVVRTGKNLLPKMTPESTTGLAVTVNNDGSITVSGTATGNGYLTQFVDLPFPIESDTTWTFSTTNNVPAQLRLFLDNNTVDILMNQKSVTVNNKAVSRIRLFLFATPNTEYNFTIYPQLELDSSATEYEPYKGEAYNITFPSEAGTVYGGKLDVTLGKLIVEYIKKTVTEFTGAWGAQPSGNYAVYTTFSDTTHSPTNIKASLMKSNIFKYSQADRNTAMLYEYGCNDGGMTTQTFILPSAITNLTEANAWLADHPTECTFKLATPVEITLTPTQINTLIGTNNIWANTGNVEVKYYADSKTYIDEQNTFVKALIAPVLNSMIADTALVINDFRIVDNTLYRVTANIASGGTLTVGTNVVATTIAEVIKPLLT